MTIVAANTDEIKEYEHVTVMPGEVVQALDPARGGLYLDVTAGGGGHSAAILASASHARVIAFDRDPNAISATQARLAEFGERAHVVQGSFADLEDWLLGAHIDRVQGLIADLGISSQQLADRERGMSFRVEGPLDMRMDPTRGETARELIARVRQEELADLIYHFGEERRSRRVAACIKQALAAGQLETTLDLRRAVVRAVGPRRIGGIDPATRTFQALRIAVNDEIGQLRTLIDLAPRVLAPGSGIAVFISFHSLEDRMVKQAFLKREIWERLTKKPITASSREQAENPRARSAKLRAARLQGES